MSRLEELIQELCPDGVEYRKLGECAEILIGEFVHKNKQTENGEYPVYNGGISNTGCYEEYNRLANKIIISARGANAGYVNRVFKPFWSGNSCYTIDLFSKDIDWNFLYYYLKANEKNLTDKQQMGGIPAVSKKQVSVLQVPVPPLAVQYEIVRILDNFTELTAELTAELTTRKKQYEYYRDVLLNKAHDVERRSIGELCDVIVGGEAPNDCIKGDYPDETHKYPVWGNGKDVYGFSTTYKVENDSVCISSIGANTGAVFFHKGGFTPIIRLKVLIPKTNEINTRFLFHVLSTVDFAPKKSSVPNMSSSDIKKTIISVPTVEEQMQIAKTLDNFEKLCEDFSEGIPAEIEARQKQYEYYRDKLLDFKRLTA